MKFIFKVFFLLILLVRHNVSYSQFISEKTTLLSAQVNELTYASNFDSAQVLVLEFLDQKDLTEEEIFYGKFLFADILKTSDNPIKAIEHLKQDLNSLPDVKDKKVYESLILGNISECYFNMLEFSKAKTFALSSIAKSPNKSLRGGGHAINNIIIGFNEFNDSNFNAALRYYQLAADQYEKYNSTCELPLTYLKMSRVYHKLNKNEKRDFYLNKSIKISDSCGILQYKIDSKRTLLEIYQSEKQFENALQTLFEINNLDEKLREEKQADFINELEIKYENRITQEENRVLKVKTRNTQLQYNNLLYLFMALAVILILTIIIIKRRIKNTKILQSHFNVIEKQNTEKEILLKEIHHRVKNNLQVVTSLLALQSNYMDDKAKEPFKNSQARVQSMAMVHEMLYQSGNLSEISLRDYLNQLLTQLVKSFKSNPDKVQVKIEVENIMLNVDTSMSLGLLVNEIITNSLKYGFEEEGVIYVKIIETNKNCFQMKIGDNGCGYKDDIDINNLKSLGLKLIHNLVKQLGGTIKRSTEEKGTNYTISFKMIDV